MKQYICAIYCDSGLYYYPMGLGMRATDRVRKSECVEKLSCRPNTIILAVQVSEKVLVLALWYCIDKKTAQKLLSRLT